MSTTIGPDACWFGTDWIEIWALGSEPRVMWFIRAVDSGLSVSIELCNLVLTRGTSFSQYPEDQGP
eukprot:3463984-Amphidinium_carterae.1